MKTSVFNIVLFFEFFLDDKRITQGINFEIFFIENSDKVRSRELNKSDFILDLNTRNKLRLLFFITFDGLVCVKHNIVQGMHEHNLF